MKRYVPTTLFVGLAIAAALLLRPSWGTSQEAKAVSAEDRELSENLVGSWKMVAADIDGEPSEVHYSAATIKHITPTGFLWLSYKPEDRIIFRSSGGSWHVRDGTYIETPRYSLQPGFRDAGFGKPVSIDCTFADDRLTQVIRFGDRVLTEVWQRMQQDEEAAQIPQKE